jgi:linoleate 10R-lipoxygenase
VDDIGKYFYETTKKLIVGHSFTLVGGKVAGVDLVKHVLRVVPVLWVATDLVSPDIESCHPHFLTRPLPVGGHRTEDQEPPPWTLHT